MRSASCALLSAAFFCSDFSAALARTAISSQPSCVGRAMPILKSQAKPHIKASVPERAKDGTLVFKDWLEFRPNLRPEEVLQVSDGWLEFRPNLRPLTWSSCARISAARLSCFLPLLDSD